MIHVVTLTRNKNLAVLEVPEDGKLTIKDKHLIVAILENGVKMTCYGETSPLLPIEVYLMGECNSVEMIQQHLFHPDGRILDFTNIELLQTQNTIHPSNSGSTNEYKPFKAVVLGYDVDWAFAMKGYNLETFAQVEDFFNVRGANANILCNGITTDETGLQKYSIYNFKELEYDGFGASLKEFYDLKGYVTELTNDDLTKATSLQVLSLPYLPWYRWAGTMRYDMNSLMYIDIRRSVQLGSNPQDAAIFGGTKLPIGVELVVPAIHQTNNNGAMHAGLQYLVDNRGATITFV